jgi:hypothetical protein
MNLVISFLEIVKAGAIRIVLGLAELTRMPLA